MYVACPTCRSVLEVPDGSVGASLCAACGSAFQLGSQSRSLNTPLPSMLSPGLLPGASARPLPIARPRAALKPVGPLFFVQVVVGGIVGLALGYWILQIINEKRKTPRAAPQRERQRESRPARVDAQSDREPGVAGAAAAQPAPPTGGFGNQSAPQPQLPAPAETAPALPAPFVAAPAVPSPPVAPAANSNPQVVPQLQAEPPQLPAATPRLGNVTARVELPSLLNVGTVPILSLAQTPGALDLFIEGIAADIPAEARYFLEPNEANDAWIISYTPNAAAKPPEVTKVARLTRQSGALHFQWAKTAGIESLKHQLSNCVLRIRHAEQYHQVQLRPVVATAHAALNLESEGSAPLEFSVPHFPNPKSIFCEIDAPASGAFAKEASSAGLGKSVLFQFADFSGAQIAIRTIHKKSANVVALRLDPEFDEGNAKFELTQDRLEEMRKRWTQSGQEATAKLKAADNELQTLQRQRSSMASQSGGTSAERANREHLMLGLDRRIKSLADRIPSLRKRIAEAKARLDAAPEVEEFLKKHHGKPLHFRIYAQAGDHRIGLVETRPAP